MARITAPLETDDRMKWKTFTIRVDGIQFCGVTEATGQAAVDRLVAICEPRAQEIRDAHDAYTAATKANTDAYKRDGDYRNCKERPAHKAWNKLINSLMREAGIRDT